MDEIKHELDDDVRQIIKAVNKKYKPTNISTMEKQTKSIAKSIEEIICNTHERNWIFPVFQRDYVWSTPRVKSLLESILLDNFIGSFLMWKIKNKKDLPFETRDIGEKAYNDTINATGIILDGKQRTTSLYKVLKEKDPKFPYYYVNFLSLANRYIPDKKKIQADNKKIQPDIIITKTEKLKDDDMYENFYFPLYEINRYKEWINKLKDYYEEDKDVNYFANNFIEEKLKHFWKEPIVPVITLHEHIRPESVPMIFELINTKGLKLNTFDILVAHLAYQSQFKINLRSVWNKVRDNDLEINKGYEIFGQDLPLSIIQGMYLYYSGGELSPSEDNILKMFDERYRNDSGKFDREWNDFVEITREAIRKITIKYGVLNKNFLPATSLLPPLIANLKRVREIKTNIPVAYDKIDMWYWSAVFSGEYKAGTTTVMAKDTEAVKNWLEKNKLPQENVVRKARSMWNNEKESINRLKELSLKSAMYKGVLCLLALKNPQGFFTSERSNSITKNDLDHIFPEDMFKSENNKHEKKIPKKLKSYRDSVINKTILSIRDNRGLKNDSPPSDITKELIKEYKSKPQKLKEILDSHLITTKAFEAMKNDDFEKFLEARGKAILEEIRRRIGAK